VGGRATGRGRGRNRRRRRRGNGRDGGRGGGGLRGGDRRNGGGGRRRRRRGGAAGAGLGTCDAGGDGAVLNVQARPEEVLSRSVGAAVRETEDTNVPVRAVGASARGNGGHYLGEGCRALRSPEADLAGGEVDVVGEVVPGAGDEGSRPLRNLVHHPAEGVVRGAGRAGQEAVLEFGKVTLWVGDGEHG
jgi:hypothetical protein